MSAWRQLRFDLTRGIPCALGVLSRHLGVTATAKVGFRFLWHSLWYRTPPQLQLEAPSARFTWRQLRPVLLLERALEESTEDPKPILAEVVAETGAAFIASQVPIKPTQWAGLDDGQRQRLAQTSLERFGNAQADIQEISPSRLSFDVQRCEFVVFCHALSRPDLAPLFCAADRRFFGLRDDVRLLRSETLAQGDPRCTFRFHLPEDKSPP